MNQYQKYTIDREKEMSNEELLDEVIELAAGDGYDGCFTKQGLWEFQYLKKKLYERLASWLSQDKGNKNND